MDIKLIVIGKTDENFIEEAFEKYIKRIKHYINFSSLTIKDIKNVKNLSENEQKILEGEKILGQILPKDILILLDEKGKEFTSREFADFIAKQGIIAVKHLIFVIGGPYGFSENVYKRANWKISLSKMTFSHQIVRVIFAEQLYRAFSIINNDAYHHD